jgi:SAM-dependent methyltransferase
LVWRAAEVGCARCAQRFEIVDGIPVFAVLDGDPHKQEQAELAFDAAAEQWEIRRPSGAPALYGWLMLEKFRRSLLGIEEYVPGRVALVVCAGSGMDAEFLARRGARVLASDLSLGAALRARERAKLHSVALTPLVADVEALPFPDQVVDLTYVHDGLHHLRDPDLGLREMARVAGRALSVNEPAQALVTDLAIRAGIALEDEPAGNRVERLDSARVQALLGELDFRIVGAERYAMFYRHYPGPAMRVLSRARLQPAARGAVRGFNAVLGGVSNKLAVQAVRRPGVGGGRPLS